MNNENVIKISRYKHARLPSDTGVVVEPLRGRARSFIPAEALRASVELENQNKSKGNSDPFSEEKVDGSQPPVDSSEETLGG